MKKEPTDFNQLIGKVSEALFVAIKDKKLDREEVFEYFKYMNCLNKDPRGKLIVITINKMDELFVLKGDGSAPPLGILNHPQAYGVTAPKINWENIKKEFNRIYQTIKKPYADS